MLGALSIVFGYFSVQIGDFIKITFTSLPNDIAAYLFGPFVAPVLGAAMDIINYIMKPTGPFFPGFTISAAVQGIIVGVGLYKKPLSAKRIFITLLISMLVVDMCLNTLWLSILYGQAFLVLFPARAVKNLIMWPILSGALYLIAKALQKAGVSGFTSSGRRSA
jgi:ECF transporter S component (folate family)